MKMKRHTLLAIVFVMGFLISASSVNAKTIILTPADGTDCFDAGFNQTAYEI